MSAGVAGGAVVVVVVVAGGGTVVVVVGVATVVGVAVSGTVVVVVVALVGAVVLVVAVGPTTTTEDTTAGGVVVGGTRPDVVVLLAVLVVCAAATGDETALVVDGAWVRVAAPAALLAPWSWVDPGEGDEPIDAAATAPRPRTMNPAAAPESTRYVGNRRRPRCGPTTGTAMVSSLGMTLIAPVTINGSATDVGVSRSTIPALSGETRSGVPTIPLRARAAILVDRIPG